jgi:pimeloyl-ACP methyl ester carboxylesterase
MTIATPQLFEPDGRAIPFVEEGEGPVRVVLLPGHGLGVSSLGTLAHVLEEEGFHLLRVGVRTAQTDAVTMHDLAQDVVDVMAHVGLPSAWIGGHGFGGSLARTVALDHPEQVEGVALIGVEIGQMLEPASATSAAVEAADDTALLDAARALAGAADAGFARDVLARHRDLAAAPVQAAALSATAADEWATLAPNFAVLVVQGAEDSATPAANAEQLQASAPGRVSLTLVEGAGHLGILTHAGEVGFAIEDYLAWD